MKGKLPPQLLSALLISLLLNLLSLLEYIGDPPTSPKTILFAAGGVLFHLALLGIYRAKGWEWFSAAAESLTRLLSRLGLLNLLVFALAIILVSPGAFDLSARFHLGRIFLLFLSWLAVLLGGFSLRAWGAYRGKEPPGWPESLGLSLLIAAAGTLALEHLAQVTSYPFTLQWSETSRIYYASLFHAGRLYGLDLPWPVLHPSQYLTLSVPFLLPGAPLWLHRLWESLLWLGTPSITALLLVRRLSLPEKTTRWRLVLWSFVFLLASSIYFHLLFSIILVLWLFESHPESPKSRRLLSIVGLVIASLWAGLSRINWLPVPGMLAAALYLLERSLLGGNPGTDISETPAPRSLLQQITRYLTPPFFMVLGGALLAACAYAAYILLSGNPLQEFTTSYVSNMLWFRLLPNALFPPGILLGLGLYCSSLVLLVYKHFLKGGGDALHLVRWILLVAMLLVLLGGGIEVSVKIGGGNNLHNMDAFMLLLLVIALYMSSGTFTPEDGWQRLHDENSVSTSIQPRWPARNLLLACFLVPSIFVFVFRGAGQRLPRQEISTQAIAEIERYTETAAQSAGEVLFITNRHLVTFSYIQVPLVPEYERVILMEMAMASNHTYLDQFVNDIQTRRFALIITEPLSYQVKAETTKARRDESDIWAAEVMKILRRYYQPVASFREVGVELLVPKVKGQ